LANLGGASCAAPTSTNACLIDQVLAAGQRSGYNFTLSNVSGTPASSYAIIATPILSNYSGVRNFCSFEDAVLRGSLTTIDLRRFGFPATIVFNVLTSSPLKDFSAEPVQL
jgi:hypothetical protein